MERFIQVGGHPNKKGEETKPGQFFIMVRSVEIRKDAYSIDYTLVINDGEYLCKPYSEEGKKLLEWLKQNAYVITEHELTKDKEATN